VTRCEGGIAGTGCALRRNVERTLKKGTVTSEELSRTLDGTIVGTTRTIRVISVVVEQGRRWIQLDLIGLRHYSLLISVDLTEDAASIRRALQWWLAGDRTAERGDEPKVAIHNAVVRSAVNVEQDETPSVPRRSFFFRAADRAAR
jgi:hypothetical protein